MFKCEISGITCKLSLLFPAVLLFLLLVDVDGTALFCFSAAVLHECAHGVMLCVCRIKPETLTFSFFGMRLDLPPCYRMSLRQMVLVAAAGPLANAGCALVLQSIGAKEEFVLAHLVLAALNSLPVKPLDGGQVISLLCERVCSREVAARLESGMFWVAWLCLIVLGVAVCLHSGGNFTLLVVAFYVGCLRLFCKCD